ncbi:MAG: ATP synthase F1 subunit delta [Thermodesulfovibrionales bacterium]|nr:ATP synthase F1 subunit delta [Thermodesulfovibrionales bacterium]
MKKNKQAKRYAKTLIETAGMDAAPKALSELNTLNALMAESRELTSLLTGPQFTAGERKAVLKEMGARLGFSENTVRFVSHLTELGAMTAFREIINHAVAIYLERKKMAKAQVITSTAVGGQYEGRLKASLKNLTGRDVEIEYVTDPSLLGGMLIKVGSTMYDGSIKGQLRLLKDELVKG